MQIKVNTHRHIDRSTRLTRHVESVVEAALAHFADRIASVEVDLFDETIGSTVRNNDSRCVMEARLPGLQPITARHQDAILEQAITRAADGLEKALGLALDRSPCCWYRPA